VLVIDLSGLLKVITELKTGFFVVDIRSFPDVAYTRETRDTVFV